MNTTQNTPDDFDLVWREFADNGGVALLDFKGPRIDVAGFSGYTLFRSGYFQIQAWVCPPNRTIHEHRHPNIDIIQVYVTGQIYLVVNGREITSRRLIERERRYGRTMNGREFRIRPGEAHGFSTGEEGGVFLSAELWNTEPTSAEMDWDGEPIDQKHANLLCQNQNQT